jgi:hypothetical protein
MPRHKCESVISNALGLNQAYDTNATLTYDFIYAVKDLRNAVAHNDIIFDTRYKNASIGNTLPAYLNAETTIANITFDTLIDYFILIIYLLKLFKVPRRDLQKLIYSYENINEALFHKVPFAIYSTIVHTDTRNKISQLRKFI